MRQASSEQEGPYGREFDDDERRRFVAGGRMC